MFFIIIIVIVLFSILCPFEMEQRPPLSITYLVKIGNPS
jgi:hypothetical protein